MMYGSPSYQMGDDEALVAAAATAPITKDQAVKAKRELQRMRASLTSWLKYRAVNDQIAAGAADAVKTPMFKTPGASPPPAAVMALRMRRSRAADETELALQLHALLSEVFDAGALPSPDVAKNPNAAVLLAQIAIAGRLPGETTSPGAAGFIWLWPLVIVVGAIAFVITSIIRSRADEAKEREHLECVKAGKCTDSGFWLKVGSLAVIGWLLWDKAGVGVRVRKAIGGSRGK